MVPATIAPEASRKLLARYDKAYLEQIGEDRVLHLKGTHYEMGYQHGTLMKEEIEKGIKRLRAIGGVAWKGDFQASLREAWERTSPFIPEKYKQEMQGMADATDIPFEELCDFAVFPGTLPLQRICYVGKGHGRWRTAAWSGLGLYALGGFGRLVP